MYKVYCDSLLMYQSGLESLKIFNPSVDLELNKTGSFLFKVYPNHPHYSLLKKLKSIIAVWQDDYLLFRGRILNDEIGFYNEKSIVCEGDLAFLLDSIQRPFAFTGTALEFFTLVIGNHNSQVEAEKRFVVGTVTVSGSFTVSLTDYPDSLDTLQKQLVDRFGGYIRTRQSDGVNYIDYLAESSLLAPQEVKFGKNLIDLKRIRKGEEIATALIPLGAMIENTEQRLTIASVNGGLDYIVDEDAKDEYRTIVKKVVFDDITDASELLRKGKAYLSDLVNLVESVELSAADLAAADNNIESFHLGTQVQVTSVPHGINQRFLVSKLLIDLLNPAANKMVLGGVVKPFSVAISGIVNNQSQILQAIEKTAQTANLAAYELEQKLSTQISQTESRINTNVSKNYYLKGDTEKLVSSVRTDFEQTEKAFELLFTEFEADIEDLSAGTDAEFREIKKYIRFVDGSIVLGESGNELTLKIENDRIGFLDGNHEVAYFSNHKLYVSDGEFLNTLRIGNFVLAPRANGNLSFTKAF